MLIKIHYQNTIHKCGTFYTHLKYRCNVCFEINVSQLYNPDLHDRYNRRSHFIFPLSNGQECGGQEMACIPLISVSCVRCTTVQPDGLTVMPSRMSEVMTPAMSIFSDPMQGFASFLFVSMWQAYDICNCSWSLNRSRKKKDIKILRSL